jgi:AcrR family transcriptional regulator
MNEREEQLINAALGLFFRYGMAKTTMADVAREAGLSRQSVYASFTSKEDLLRACTRYLADQTVAGLESGFASTRPIADKLDIIFDCIAARHYALIHQSPEADDVISGFNSACKSELAEAGERYQALIAEQLQSCHQTIEHSGLTVEQLAEYILRTTKALKYEARDETHLRFLWQAQRSLLLGLLGDAKQ